MLSKQRFAGHDNGSVVRKLRQNLDDFNRGRLPFFKLKKTVGELNKIYNGQIPDGRYLFNYSEPGKEWNEPEYIKYANMPLVERAVQIARDYPPGNFDTIVGIDRGGRPYAKIVKSVFDGVRKKQGLSRIKILFLNVHVGHYDTNNWNIKIENKNENSKFMMNNVLSGKDFGNILVIDDYRSSGETRVCFANGIEKLQEQGVKIDYDYDNHIYFLGQNGGGTTLEYRSLDFYNDLFFKFYNCFLVNAKPREYQVVSDAPRAKLKPAQAIPLFVSTMPPTSRHEHSPVYSGDGQTTSLKVLAIIQAQQR